MCGLERCAPRIVIFVGSKKRIVIFVKLYALYILEFFTKHLLLWFIQEGEALTSEGLQVDAAR